jgi:hypothetical protein
MSKEQEAVARAGGGAAADEALQKAGEAGQGGDEAGGPGGNGSGGESGSADAEGGAGGGSSSSRGGRGGSQQAGSTVGDEGVAPEEQAATVKGCNDTEKVARQLCEAATAEQDPFLRAALWDEYNEYKKILARQ